MGQMQKLRPVYAFLVFLSGYAPMGPLLAILDFRWQKLGFENPEALLAINCALLFCTRFTAWHFSQYRKGNPMKVISADDASDSLLGYAIPYVAGFVGIDLGLPNQIMAVAFIIWIIFYTTYHGQTVVLNPHILALGYRVYTCELEYRTGRRTKGTVIAREGAPQLGSNYRFETLAEGYFFLVHDQC